MSGFEYYRPSHLHEATSVLLEGGPRAHILGGGTDLIPRIKRAQLRPDVVVDLSGIEPLRQVTVRAEGLHLGALVSPFELARHGAIKERFPAVARASRLVGAQQIRNMATLGGAIASGLRCQLHDQSPQWRESMGPCFHDGADHLCHATGETGCVATQASDLPPMVAALEGQATIFGPEGERVSTIESLVLERGEVLTGVLLPWPKPSHYATYRKLRLRKAVDRPLIGMGMSAAVDGSLRLRTLNIVACGCGPSLGRFPQGHLFEGSALDNTTIEAIAVMVRDWFTPSAALRVDMAWRQGMAGVLARNGLTYLAHVAEQKNTSSRPGRASEERPND